MGTKRKGSAEEKCTVISSYQPEELLSGDYQSEAELEKELIRMLTEQDYEYLPIHAEADLISNLRVRLEKLNGCRFSDTEWDRFFKEKIGNANEGIEEKARKIQEDFVQNLTRDDGSVINITLIDKKNLERNSLQVINQYTENRGRYDNRYDVTILVNGLPLVHMELKRRGVLLKEAFNQINRYQRDSFWAGSGLYEYVQIFVISNGTSTKYYSNTTRWSHVDKNKNPLKRSRKSSSSFEFTNFWADGENKPITDLVDFTKTFLRKYTLLNILTRYCVFTTEKQLLVMRPYQIAATERILKRIETSTEAHREGTAEAGGYIWHTTGSGKTLTSFKTAQLASELPYIDKVLFVVDRKDLDYQTVREYDRFEKGAANGNRSTAVLARQLGDSQSRIIVTTIQKLDRFIKQNPDHSIRDKHVVLIFDECHRSQFGDSQARISGGGIREKGKRIKVDPYFRRYHMFGFTGTPIFAENASTGVHLTTRTTEQLFGERLHTYTIVDAINDGNVLPFRIDFVNTVQKKEGRKDEQVFGIDTEEAMASPGRIRTVVQYILDHFDQKTCRNKYYSLKDQRVQGFNSMLAVSSIPLCKKYYLEFKKQLAEQHRDLRIATIFSFAPNEEEAGGLLSEEGFDTSGLDASSRDFLEGAIRDYNEMFHTNFSTSGNGFEDYYKDVSYRMKNRDLDLLIVVNMFLTGFDAPSLNTLWVDKKLRMHGLIQAFSRTNRILNSVKAYGNIICFRDLEEAVDKAIALFGNKDARGIVCLRAYRDYYFGYTDERGHQQRGYETLVNQLLDDYPLGKEIIGEKNQKNFLVLFGNLLHVRNILSGFDEFEGQELLSPIEFQDYTGMYNDIYEKFRRRKKEKASILDDVVFEAELIKQVEVNIDYILLKVAEYAASGCQDKEIRASITKAIQSSIKLRSKQELIEKFISTVNAESDVRAEWKTFVNTEREADVSEIIEEEDLEPKETRRFMDNAFLASRLRMTGTQFDQLIPPLSRFDGSRAKKKKTVIGRLKSFFEKYFDIIDHSDIEADYNILAAEKPDEYQKGSR